MPFYISKSAHSTAQLTLNVSLHIPLMNFSRLYTSLRSRAPEGLDEMRVVVQAVINDREQYKRVLEVRGDEAQQCLDALQVVSSYDL